MSLDQAEMGCVVHIIGILCTVLSGSADLKTALVCSSVEATNATSGMGRLTLHQTVSLVVILRFLPVLPLHIHLSRGTFAVALMSLFLQPKEKVLRRARRLWGTDGDGVSNSDPVCTHVLDRGGKGVRSPLDGPGKVSYTDPHKTPG